MNNTLKDNLDEWHRRNQFDTIISVLSGLPDEELTDDYLGRLASAYNNVDAYDRAIATLNRVSPSGQEDALWCYRMGYSHYHKNDFHAALAYFEKSHALGDDEAIFFVEFCRDEIADPGSANESRHPGSMNTLMNVDDELDYVKVFTTDQWTTVSFQCDAEAPKAAARRLLAMLSGNKMTGHHWNALIRRFIAVYEPHLLENLQTDPETTTFTALYPTSEFSEQKAQLIMSIILFLVEEEGEMEGFIEAHGGSIAWD